MRRTHSRQDCCLPGTTARGRGIIQRQLLLSAALLGAGGLSAGHARAQAAVPQQAVTPQSPAGVDIGSVPVTAPAPTLTNDQRLQQEGTAAQGYKSDTAASVGPLGSRPLLNTPYTITEVPKELIENTIAGSQDDVWRRVPLVQNSGLPVAYGGNPYVVIRGFSAAFSDLQNGLYLPYVPVEPLETMERIEVLSGLAGFLNGGASGGRVGGSVDYITKRPTATPLADVTIGDYGGSSLFAHADISDEIGDGRLAYRLNVLAQDGHTSVDDQKVNRWLVSGALDFHATDKLLLQLNLEAYHYRLDGVAPLWQLGTGVVSNPAAPDASKLFSQPWTYAQRDVLNLGSNVTYEVNDHVTLRGAMLYGQQNVLEIFALNRINSNGSYNQTLQPGANQYTPGISESAFADVTFDTGPIGHKVTVGFRGITQQAEAPRDYETATSTNNIVGTLNDPARIAESAVIYNGTYGRLPTYVQQTSSQSDFALADTIDFTHGVSGIFGVNFVNVASRNYNTSGSTTSKYNKTAPTPTLALLYQPIRNLTAYVGYMQSLEPGQFIGPGYTNAGQTLPPLLSEQEEIGVKYDTGKALLTAALFRIDKGNQYSNNVNPIPTIVQDGREVHQGVELTATGKITDALTIIGGFSDFNASVQQTSNPALVGKEPVGVSEVMAKMYAEYAVPYLEGLTLTGGVYVTGPFYGNNTNTNKLPSVATGDLGFRYVTNRIAAQPVILRFDVVNIADASYWQTPNFVGNPRTVAFSLSTRF